MLSDAEIFLCVTQSIKGDVRLNSIEKSKVAILHTNRDRNHCAPSHFLSHDFEKVSLCVIDLCALFPTWTGSLIFNMFNG